MSDRIFLHGGRLPCRIGVTAEERASLQEVLVDIEIEIDLSTAGGNDDLRSTLDYAAVWRAAQGCAAEAEYHLLEALATRIGKRCLALGSLARSATVWARKPRILTQEGVDSVGVRLTVRR